MPELLVRRAALSPQTANAEARTVEVIWSSGAPVRRRDMAGSYIERLSLDTAAVDLSRLIGASVLDAHRQSAVRDVLGTVREAHVDGRQGGRDVAVLRKARGRADLAGRARRHSAPCLGRLHGRTLARRHGPSDWRAHSHRHRLDPD